MLSLLEFGGARLLSALEPLLSMGEEGPRISFESFGGQGIEGIGEALMVAFEFFETLQVKLVLIRQALRVVSCDFLCPGAFRLGLGADGRELRNQPGAGECPSDDGAEKQPEEEHKNVTEVHVSHCARGP